MVICASLKSPGGTYKVICIQLPVVLGLEVLGQGPAVDWGQLHLIPGDVSWGQLHLGLACGHLIKVTFQATAGHSSASLGANLMVLQCKLRSVPGLGLLIKRCSCLLLIWGVQTFGRFRTIPAWAEADHCAQKPLEVVQVGHTSWVELGLREPSGGAVLVTLMERTDSTPACIRGSWVLGELNKETMAPISTFRERAALSPAPPALTLKVVPLCRSLAHFEHFPCTGSYSEYLSESIDRFLKRKV